MHVCAGVGRFCFLRKMSIFAVVGVFDTIVYKSGFIDRSVLCTSPEFHKLIQSKKINRPLGSFFNK